MQFLDREPELRRLDALAGRGAGGLAVVWGRRRIGKTRLLLEWCERGDGLYSVADQSTPRLQRRYLAETLAARLPGFADVDYRDWWGLLRRLADEARLARWGGPVVFDEFPYLVATSPELPSVMQRWLDHDARQAGLTVAIAGSSQRMMQGLVLDENAPLYGRAEELIALAPLGVELVVDAYSGASPREIVEFWSAWGGVPRYWELALREAGSVARRVDHIVLDPLGPLHHEPARLLLEELPSAVELRPVLDAIGLGAHRVSEIAGRMGRPATSMSRPLARLVGMGLVERQVPFGEAEKKSRRAIYTLADPFFRLWFRVVASHQALLVASAPDGRRHLLEKYWPHLVASAWEELCRRRTPRAPEGSRLGARGPWGPAARWWRGHAPEWDVVAESLEGRRLLLGEANWRASPLDDAGIERLALAVQRRPAPELPPRYRDHDVQRVLFVPDPAKAAGTPDSVAGVLVVTAEDIVGR